jgi:hypothetical protein
MNRLTRVLADVKSKATDQGGGLSGPAVAALNAYRLQASIVSWLVLLAVLAAFVVALVGSAIYLRDPGQIKLVASGLGLSMGGALIALRSTWKDWSQANLLLALIEDANEVQIQAVIDTLIKKL